MNISLSEKQTRLRAYTEAFERLVDLQERQKEQHYRSTLLAKLEKSAPNWAAAIQQRGGMATTVCP
jgi:hypothetical protein